MQTQQTQNSFQGPKSYPGFRETGSRISDARSLGSLILIQIIPKERTLRFQDEDDYEDEIFSILSAWTSVILAGKRDSRRYSTTGFNENVVVAETSYQMWADRNIPKFKDRANWSRDTVQPMRRRACVYQNIDPVIKNFHKSGRSRTDFNTSLQCSSRFHIISKKNLM